MKPKHTTWKNRHSSGQQYSVSTRSGCLECKVYAHNAREAKEMAIARNSRFQSPDTVAKLVPITV